MIPPPLVGAILRSLVLLTDFGLDYQILSVFHQVFLASDLHFIAFEAVGNVFLILY
jgi:hypothetical protein